MCVGGVQPKAFGIFVISPQKHDNLLEEPQRALHEKISDMTLTDEECILDRFLR